jgi:hypothetical protein
VVDVYFMVAEVFEATSQLFAHYLNLTKALILQ